MLIERIKYQYSIFKDQGFTYFVGLFKRTKYIKLQKKYGFDEWHITPYELRPYAYCLVGFLNSLQRINNVVEVGCGLGDIIRNINAPCKYGYDISMSVINCAKQIDSNHRGGKTTFICGGFEDVKEFDKPIDVLITVNFIHNIPIKDLEFYYKRIFKINNVKGIVFDSVEADGYKYNHELLLIKFFEKNNYNCQIIFRDERRKLFFCIKE